jgi:hypothetical protein
MSDDETRPIEPEGPEAPVPPAPPAAAQPAYAMPLPAGYPAYAVPQRPRFADQVMGMRAVVATALACLIVGGLGGFVLGRATGEDHARFMGPGGGFFQQRGAFPDGPGAGPVPNGQLPNGQFRNGQPPGSRNGIPQQQFHGSNPNR